MYISYKYTFTRDACNYGIKIVKFQNIIILLISISGTKTFKRIQESATCHRENNL